MRRITLYFALICLIAIAGYAGEFELLVNGGFETGDLTGWNEDSGAGEGNVVQETAGSGDGALVPGTPLSGQWFFSSCVADGAAPYTGFIGLNQVIDVSGFSQIAGGTAQLEARGEAVGAEGGASSSDDTVLIQIQFWQGGVGGTLLGEYATPALDPIVGTWNPMHIPLMSVPDQCDAIFFRYLTMLDTGYASIDIGGDDLSVTLYVPDTIQATLNCAPTAGTVPFITIMTVHLENIYLGQTRRIAGRINVSLAGGRSISNWRSGYTNVAAGDFYESAWGQTIPALASVIGDNVFELVAEDVTPAPFNQPPWPAAGDTAVSSCAVTGIAP